MSPRATPWGTYTQIADVLRHRITSGHLEPGSPLPSESALGQEFRVSRTTIRRALAALEADRLIRTIPGTGRIVCDPNESPPGNQPRYRRIATHLRDQISRGDLSPGG
ncbi:GntR family transcriptional regulator, partial [Klebsiella pneumoniae]